MRGIVQQLEGQADLVILDTVAALAVSDSLPLLRAVSGCVVIVRMNRSARAAVRRLQKILGSAQGTVLGAVATGSAPTAAGYGAYPYTENGHRGVTLGLLHLRHAHSRAPSDKPSPNGSSLPDSAKQPTD
jgi:Mrp family chromosome partitioning ATPase